MRQLGILILAAVLFMGATCERSLELSFPDEEPQLIVISNFTSDQDLQVQVSLAKDVLDDPSLRYIQDAQVRVFEGEEFIERLQFVIPKDGSAPYYTSRILEPKIGVEYNIQVLVQGFEPLNATSMIPNNINIDKVQVKNLVIEYFPETRNENYTFDLLISFMDPADEKNYYHLKLFQQFENYRVELGDTITFPGAVRELLFGPSINDNFQVAHFEGGILLEDAPFEGETNDYVLPLSVDINTLEELPGQMIVELRTVSEEYFRFYSTVSRQIRSQELNYVEPVIIFNNIENGQGVFAGYSNSIVAIPIFIP